jgi:hypothetical protein
LEAVGEQVTNLFGDACRSGWALYKAGHDKPITSKQSEEAEHLCLKGREDFVLEWTHEVPEEVRIALCPLQYLGERPEDTCISLEDCIKWSQETSQMDEGCLVECKGCKEKKRVFKRLELWSLPPVLLIQLKRFEIVNPMYGRARRLNTPVRYPLEGLDMAKFCPDHESFPAGECLRAEQLVQIHGLTSEAGKKLNGLQGIAMYLDTKTGRFCVQTEENQATEDWKRIQPKNLRPVLNGASKVPPLYFDLVGISMHMGAAYFGHYTSYARSSEDGLWRLFDDEHVAEVSPERVASEVTGAYVLFYLRRDLRPASWGRPQDEERAW